ncbi:IMP cyclohydrolase [Desulfothermus naphthae]
MEFLKIKRALISVTDKSNLVEFANFLMQGGVEIISTGGTKKKLEQAGIKVTSVSDVTKFPEILNGRVKTLHPHIHAGILADKENSKHMETLEKLNIKSFDLICVNLYNFEGALKQGLKGKDLIEQIDIGGPTLLRAAAKNYFSVAVVPDTTFYKEIIDELKNNDFSISLKLRKKMAAKTFYITSNYDKMIYESLSKE